MSLDASENFALKDNHKIIPTHIHMLLFCISEKGLSLGMSLGFNLLSFTPSGFLSTGFTLSKLRVDFILNSVHMFQCAVCRHISLWHLKMWMCNQEPMSISHVWQSAPQCHRSGGDKVPENSLMKMKSLLVGMFWNSRMS